MMQKLFIQLTLFLLFCFPASGYSQTNPIVFSSDRSGNFEIYTMQPDGANITRLTNNHGRDIQPCWTPDGKRIVFSSDRDGDPEIFSMNIDGTDVHQLTHNTTIDKAPAVSPNGKFIAYYNSDWLGNPELYLMNIDGTGQHIVPNTSNGRYPSWSPDSSFLMYEAWVDASFDYEIFKCQLDGSNLVNLTNTPSFSDRYPSVSPDGKYIVFLSFRSGSWQLHRMSPNGNNVTQLTTNMSTPKVYSRVAWSPNSKTILFPQSHDIYSMRSDGTGQSNLTNTAGADGDPNWRRKKKMGLSKLMSPVLVNRYVLSTVQKVFVRASGYPQQFTKIFDIQNGKKKVVETWVYSKLGVMESFVDGKFVSEKVVGNPNPSVTPGELHPEDYRSTDTPHSIVSRHGTPMSITKEQDWMGPLIIYRYSNAAFGFIDGKLASVIFTSNQFNVK